MKEITIVTAFFDIGRSNYKTIPRSNEKYIEWFEQWARMKNRLIVYCGNSLVADRVMEIRNKFNLKEKTEIVVIEDLFLLEGDLYKRLKNVSEDYYFKNFRLLKNAASNIPAYDLINYLKLYFMNDAQRKYSITTQIAWMDFGFNHGGDLYSHPEDYDFEWSYDFGDKVTLFYFEPLDERPIFEIVRTLKPDCIMGCPIICPTGLVEELWLMFLQSAIELTNIGLIDDDQVILLMVYRKKPEIIKLIASDWFLPLKTYGGEHMRVVNKIAKGTDFLRKIKRVIDKRIKIFKYLKRTYKLLIKQKGI